MTMPTLIFLALMAAVLAAVNLICEILAETSPFGPLPMIWAGISFDALKFARGSTAAAPAVVPPITVIDEKSTVAARVAIQTGFPLLIPLDSFSMMRANLPLVAFGFTLRAFVKAKHLFCLVSETYALICRSQGQK
jgi:hypothetical protein